MEPVVYKINKIINQLIVNVVLKYLGQLRRKVFVLITDATQLSKNLIFLIKKLSKVVWVLFFARFRQMERCIEPVRAQSWHRF